MLFEKFQNNPFAKVAKCDSTEVVPSSNYATTIIPGREIAAAAAVSNVILPGDSCAFGSTKYFLLCGMGGIISCGTTHTMVSKLEPLCQLCFVIILVLSPTTGRSIRFSQVPYSSRPSKVQKHLPRLQGHNG